MPSEFISPEGALAVTGGKLLYDVFGDTAKLLGKRLATYADRGLINFEDVVRRASRRAHIRGKTSGAVPARVVQHLLPEACFCEDRVQAEYLGGILASSKGPIARDDRAVPHITLLSSLSTYQIRTHYLLYSCILRWKGKYADQIGRWLGPARGITVALNEAEFQEAMEFSSEEPVAAICQHIFAGLEQRGLAEGGISVVHSKPNIPNHPSVSFRYFYPTTLGIELFMWGLGHGDQTICLHVGSPP